LSSSIAHYERWFLMRADFVAPPFASEPRPHLTTRYSEPRAAVMTSSQHVCEVCPRKDKRGFDLISDVRGFGPALIIRGPLYTTVHRLLYD
jgi:hypothetical protein